MRADLLARTLELRERGEAVALVTELTTGLQTLVVSGVMAGDAALPELVLAAARRQIAADKSAIHEADWFIHVLNPAPRLIIIGAVHIAQALAPMAALAGYAVTVVDPRRAFATDARFPSYTLRGDWPDEALDELKPDARTAIVTLTHDPKLDDPALQRALASPAFYIGALGSRKTHASRLDRLRAEGFDEAAMARIHGPAGLNIGALTQSEIAVSILAQMTAARRRVLAP
jgi:xanthine dehydrogenase accessory factor